MELGYNEFIITKKESRMDYLQEFADYCYSKNPLGIENIKFNCYCNSKQGEFSDEEFKIALSILLKTEEYINEFDKDKLEQEGCAYDIDNLISIEDIDKIYEKLELVDRKRTLAGIYKKVCGDLEINVENHEKLHIFLGKVSWHFGWRDTVIYNGEMLCDPLVLLEIKEMKCGQVNRIICDLIDSVGGKSRVVQLGGHVIAEIYYDLNWHYFDADAFMGGNILKINGEIPSVQEMSKNPYIIDQLGPLSREVMISDKYLDSLYYPSGAYFCKEAYTTEPYVFYKIASDYECLNELYGWNCYEIVEDKERNLDATSYRCVGIPVMLDIKVEKGEVYLKWEKAFDADNDLLGYKIYVSEKSRGWEYSNIYAEGEAIQYVVGSYQFDQYDVLTDLPFKDTAYIETTETETMVKLDKGIYYISIMPFDKHGEESGVKLYVPSNELKVTVKEREF